MFSQLITERMAHIPAMMEFGISSPIPEPRRFDNVDILTGTPEPDAFELDAPGFKRIPLYDDFIYNSVSIDRANNLISSFGVTADSEDDILVYQEQDRSTYLDRFQAPTARSYTYIEDFDPIDDEIIVGEKTYQINDDSFEFIVNVDPSEVIVFEDIEPYFCNPFTDAWCHPIYSRFPPIY